MQVSDLHLQDPVPGFVHRKVNNSPLCALGYGNQAGPTGDLWAIGGQ
jgi:hypothetical protein